MKDVTLDAKFTLTLESIEKEGLKLELWFF